MYNQFDHLYSLTWQRYSTLTYVYCIGVLLCTYYIVQYNFFAWTSGLEYLEEGKSLSDMLNAVFFLKFISSLIRYLSFSSHLANVYLSGSTLRIEIHGSPSSLNICIGQINRLYKLLKPQPHPPILNVDGKHNMVRFKKKKKQYSIYVCRHLFQAVLGNP